METMYESKQNAMATHHQLEVEQKSQEYADKMESDQQKYQQLFNEMQEEAKLFSSRILELESHHSSILKELDRENWA